MQLTYLGSIIERYWLTLPRIIPIVRLHEHVVVPSALHGIVRLGEAQRQNVHPMHVREAPGSYAAGVQRVHVRFGNTVHWSPRGTIETAQDVIVAFMRETNRVYRLMHGIGQPGLWSHDANVVRLHGDRALSRARMELRAIRGGMRRSKE